MYNCPDDPERVASPGQAPSDYQPKPRDPDAEYSGNLLDDCDSTMLWRRAEKILEGEDNEGKTGVQLMARMSQIMDMLKADDEFEDDSIFGLVGSMKANADAILNMQPKSVADHMDAMADAKDTFSQQQTRCLRHYTTKEIRNEHVPENELRNDTDRLG